jgi:hypothetical protein
MILATKFLYIFKIIIQTESSYIFKNIAVIFLFGNGAAEPGYFYPITNCAQPVFVN